MKASIVTPSDTPRDTPSDTVAPLTAPYRKDFSLSSGAKFLGIGKNTLKRAIERGEVKATKNAAGHYTIEGAQIFQHQQNLKADQLQAVPTPPVTRSDTSVGTPVSRGSDTRSDTSIDTGATPVPTPPGDTPMESENERILKVENAALKEKIDVMENRYTDYKTMVEQTLRLLPAPPLESGQDKHEPNEVGQGGNSSMKWWLTSAAMALVLFGVAYVWQDEIKDVWQGLSGTSEIEPVAQSETLSQLESGEAKYLLTDERESGHN